MGFKQVQHLLFIDYSKSFSFELRSMQLLYVLEKVLNYHKSSCHLFVRSGSRPQAPAKPPDLDCKGRHERHAQTHTQLCQAAKNKAG